MNWLATWLFRKSRKASKLELQPYSGIRIEGGKTYAFDLPAWLRISDPSCLKNKKWVRLAYASSFFDDPLRPLIRFTLQNGSIVYDVMNGPVVGVGKWIGRVPEGTVEIDISPTNRCGRFDFALHSVKAVSRVSLIMRGFARGLRWPLWAIIARCIGARGEARQALRFAATSTPLSSYRRWKRARTRELDLTGIDQPRFNWGKGPTFHLFLRGKHEDAVYLRTARSLINQAYPKWLIHTQQHFGRLLTDDRISVAEPSAGYISESDFLVFIEVGDELSPNALAIVSEYSRANVSASAFYGDEEVSNLGKLWPILKPNYTRLHDGGELVSRALFCKASALPHDRFEFDVRISGWALKDAKVTHIRRVLSRRTSLANECVRVARTDIKAGVPVGGASIIIPTKDRRELLEKCFTTLTNKTNFMSFELIVVDNGSTEKGALDFLKKISQQKNVKVLRWPGPFNFSAMCNFAAKRAQHGTLIFLNNDVEVIEPNWLSRLVELAERPDVGTVGAKLIFPNGTIQHAGVVLGLGGFADHLNQGAKLDDPGYLRQLECMRDVSASTGACLAISKVKFESVGGFDEINLPVDLSDIDICLRLAERGWRNVWTPKAMLIHHESASRGRVLNWFSVYKRERTYFESKWLEKIRDDRFYHPGMSLFSFNCALA